MARVLLRGLRIVDCPVRIKTLSFLCRRLLSTFMKESIVFYIFWSHQVNISLDGVKFGLGFDLDRYQHSQMSRPPSFITFTGTNVWIYCIYGKKFEFTFAVALWTSHNPLFNANSATNSTRVSTHPVLNVNEFSATYTHKMLKI